MNSPACLTVLAFMIKKHLTITDIDLPLQRLQLSLLRKNLSHVMRLWYFSSSVNSFFKRACAVIQWGLDVWFFVRHFVYFHMSYMRTTKALARLQMHRLAWAFAGRLCDKYHNLMSWLKCLFRLKQNACICILTVFLFSDTWSLKFLLFMIGDRVSKFNAH